MELELTEEQAWISESIDTLFSREWVTPQDVADASPERRRQTWTALVKFGSFGIKKDGEDGLGAVELCLIARSLGLIPQVALAPITHLAAILTTISMAALGLGVDVRVVAKSGVRVTLAVTASLLVLGLISYGLIRLAAIP